MSAAVEPQVQEEKLVRMTYVGRRVLSDGKLQHCFRSEESPLELTFWKNAKASRFQSCQIGLTYLVGSSFPSYWPNAIAPEGYEPEADRLAWQAEDRAAYQSTLKVEPWPELKAIVEELKLARRKVPATRRVAFDAWLLDALR